MPAISRSGIILFEDPAIHSSHRSLLTKVFTPRKMNALEPKIREFCARCLDSLVGIDRFDFIKDLGAQMPMRTIGYLLGIPETGQEATRDRLDEGLRLRDDEDRAAQAVNFDWEEFGDYIDWRVEHPSEPVRVS